MSTAWQQASVRQKTNLREMEKKVSRWGNGNHWQKLFRGFAYSLFPFNFELCRDFLWCFNSITILSQLSNQRKRRARRLIEKGGLFLSLQQAIKLLNGCELQFRVSAENKQATRQLDIFKAIKFCALLARGCLTCYGALVSSRRSRLHVQCVLELEGITLKMLVAHGTACSIHLSHYIDIKSNTFLSYHKNRIKESYLAIFSLRYSCTLFLLLFIRTNNDAV